MHKGLITYYIVTAEEEKKRLNHDSKHRELFNILRILHECGVILVVFRCQIRIGGVTQDKFAIWVDENLFCNHVYVLRPKCETWTFVCAEMNRALLFEQELYTKSRVVRVVYDTLSITLGNFVTGIVIMYDIPHLENKHSGGY